MGPESTHRETAGAVATAVAVPAPANNYRTSRKISTCHTLRRCCRTFGKATTLPSEQVTAPRWSFSSSPLLNPNICLEGSTAHLQAFMYQDGYCLDSGVFQAKVAEKAGFDTYFLCRMCSRPNMAGAQMVLQAMHRAGVPGTDQTATRQTTRQAKFRPQRERVSALRGKGTEKLPKATLAAVAPPVICQYSHTGGAGWQVTSDMRARPFHHAAEL